MKLKKILLQIGLLLAFVGVGVVGGQLAASANPSGVPSDAAQLVNGEGLSINPSGSANSIDGSDTDDGWLSASTYPVWNNAIYANGTKDGRVTRQTTKIYVSYTGSIVLSKPSNGNITKAYSDVFGKVNGKLVSLVSNPVVWTNVNGGSSAKAPSGYVALDVDLSKLGAALQLPINIGFSYEWQDVYSDTGTARDGWATLDNDEAALKNMAGVTIDGGGTVSSTASEVTGTAQPGLDVYLSGVDGEHTATVRSDGTYTISLGDDTLKSLNASGTIQVIEYDEFGDNQSATANVVDSVPLTISPATSTVTVTPDEWDANITGKTSDEIAAWLANKAGLTVTKSDGTAVTSADGLKFSTSSTADSLGGVTAGGSASVNINAKDSAGDASTTDATINVIRSAGVLQFGTITPLLFGGDTTMAVPSQSTLIAPGNTDGTKGYTVDISDTRAKNSPWYLSAKATPLTDGNGHTLSGDVVYADGKGSVTDLDNDNAVPVSSGTRSGDDTDAAKDWAQKGQQYTVAGSTTVPTGVYLKANPNIYSGSSSTTYDGTITWYLNDAPK